MKLEKNLFDSLFESKGKTPLILQHELAECGLACLAMIASFHGNKMNILSMRKKFDIDINGINLKEIIEIANSISLSSRPMQCELNELCKLKLPCVLHWDMSHFVVLTKVTNKYAIINNPASGIEKLSFKECGKHFTGISIEFTPMGEFKKKDERVLLKINQLWSKLVGLKKSIITLLSLSIVLQCISLISPYYIQWVIDDVLINNDSTLLLVLSIGFLLILSLNALVKWVRNWFILRVSSTLSIQMSANLFNHLLKLPINYFDKRSLGDLISKFGSVNSVKELLTTGVVEASADGAMSIVILVMMFIYSPLLSFIIIAVVLIYILGKIISYAPLKSATDEYIQANAKEDSNFIESVRCIQTIRMHSKESQRQINWLNCHIEKIGSDIKISKINIRMDIFNFLLFGIENIAIIYFGATEVIDETLTIGMLLAFVAFKNMYIYSMDNFIDNIVKFNMLSIHLERISDIALHEKEPYRESFSHYTSLIGQIELINVSFSYTEHRENTINNLTLRIKEKESIAIVGPSGCGKTTLLKLIMGLIQPSSGKILIDGIDIKNIRMDNYRKNVAAIMQNDTLLSGTIADNITFFDDNPDVQWMEKCAKLAYIHEEIISFPMGYYSLSGDIGNALSGGQIQRIILARALYKKPKILCMDEATSHLDKDNESKINNSIKAMGITRIIIAHRAETISSADHIFNLKM